jgi:hypothetical protein
VTIFYPDIASYDAGIDLAGSLSVCAKATQGTGYVNPYFAAFKAEASISGAFLFAYHFLEAGNAAAQAAACYRVVGKIPLMLDFEPATTRPTMADATTFVDAYRKLGGVCWFVYLPKWYWASSPVNSVSLAPLISRGLLLVSSSYSSYTDASSGAGWQSYGGMTPTVWQYTDALSFNGMLVDFNAYRGTHAGDQSASAIADTLNEFRSLATTGRLPVPPVPKPAPAPVPIPLLEDGENMIVITRKNGIKDVFAVNSNVGYHQAVNAAGVPTNNDTLAGAWGYFFSAFWDTTQTVLTVFGVGSTGGVFKLVWSVAGNGWSVAPISVLP